MKSFTFIVLAKTLKSSLFLKDCIKREEELCVFFTAINRNYFHIFELFIYSHEDLEECFYHFLEFYLTIFYSSSRLPVQECIE